MYSLIESAMMNKGTGAGGANTNANGKTFESKVSKESLLLLRGFTKHQIPTKKGKNDYYFVNPENTMTYVTQGGLKSYIAHFFDKHVCKYPDEAYIIRRGDKYILKILEIKNQTGPGSVSEKLETGGFKVDLYKSSLPEFTIEYAYCLSSYLKQQYLSNTDYYNFMRQYNQEKGISVFFGDDDDYHCKHDEWLNS